MAYETETQNVQNYYSNLLILQYRNKPKASATIKLGAGVYLADGLIFELNDILDLETQTGAQLDLIGQILGCPRIIYGLILSDKWFTFEKTGAYGYSDKSALSEGYWKQYKNSTGSSFALEDSDYRQLLKFKAAYNIRKGSWGDLDELYYRFFGSSIEIINTKDCSVAYRTASNTSVAFEAAKYLGYINVPMGIGFIDITNENYYIWSYRAKVMPSVSYSWLPVSYGGGKFIGVGAYNRINTYLTTSTDGFTWTTPTKNDNLSVDSIINEPTWTRVVYNGTIYVIIGAHGDVSTSSNGTDWNRLYRGIPYDQQDPTIHYWYGLAWDGTKFLAMSAKGYVSTSTDAITWTTPSKITVLQGEGRRWSDVVYGNGKFVAIDWDGNVATSTNGTDWTFIAESSTNLGSSEWLNISFNGYKFCVISRYGDVSISVDGASWQPVESISNLSTMSPIQNVVFDGSKFFAFNADGYMSYTL